jgi:hypothetical protein
MPNGGLENSLEAKPLKTRGEFDHTKSIWRVRRIPSLFSHLKCFNSIFIGGQRLIIED